MYTALERLETIAEAKARLHLLPEDPTDCVECADAVEKAMSECFATWGTLGVTSQEYADMVEQAAITTARTYLARFNNEGRRNCWLIAFEQVVERFKLDYNEFGITETEFLRLKRWTTRIPSRRKSPSTHIGTVSVIRPISELARIHIPSSR